MKHFIAAAGFALSLLASSLARAAEPYGIGLEGFAYRITLNPWYFIVVGAVALVIAWATVGVHALRVARANPIHALRHE